MGVYVGTAGFSYNDWKGNFYPVSIAQQDMLSYYSSNFPVVEINSTYYAIPSPERVFQMAKRTPVDFQFTVKANKAMTHEIEIDDVFEKFRSALRPLEDHGKLGCILFQFPWGFKKNRENCNYLEFIARRFEGIDKVVEFRNDSWETDDTFDLLRDLGLGYCCVDEPRLRGLVSTRVEVTTQVGYVRFHGRNYETWWDKGREPWERYNYLYSEEELSQWASDVSKMAEETERVYVIFNNHYKGQAPANARMFEGMLKAIIGDGLKSVSHFRKEVEGRERLF